MYAIITFVIGLAHWLHTVQNRHIPHMSRARPRYLVATLKQKEQTQR